MCFGKKPVPPPRAMYISAPVSLPFDYEKNPLPPWQNPYSTHAIHPVPAPPPKRPFTRSTYKPKPVPIFDLEWRTQPLSPRQQRFQREVEEREKEARKSPVVDLGKRWLGLSPTVRQKLFRNAGVDEHGRLELEFEAVEEHSWWDEGGLEPVRKHSMW
ncbi:hypothetical protein MMC27_000256 [Xylographa pallens]|nr:hypothetical protein [Xylographa pallens]